MDKKKRNKRYFKETITDIEDWDDLTMFANKPLRTELYWLD